VAWGDTIIDFFGNGVAVATGVLGGAGGAAAGAIDAALGNPGRFVEDVQNGWTAGAAFSPGGSLARDARSQVVSTFERFDQLPDVSPGAKFAASVVGPPRDSGDAWLSLAGAVFDAGLLYRAAGKTARVAAGGARVGLGSTFAELVGRGSSTAERLALRAEPSAGRILARGAAYTGVLAGGAFAVGTVGSYALKNTGDAAGSAAQDAFAGIGNGLGLGIKGLGQGLQSLAVPAIVAAALFVAVTVLTKPKGAGH
jgi:hypothetical protein